MKKGTIIIDIDGTKLNMIPALNKFYNQYYGTDLKVSDYKYYDLERIWGGSKGDAVAIVGRFYHSPLFLQVKPMPFARRAIAQLAREYDLISATARPDFIQEQTQAQIEQFFPGYMQQIIHTGHYKIPSAKMSKLDACLQVGATIIIDDHLGTIVECVENGIRGIMFGNQWDWGENGQVDYENTERAYNWREVLEHLK